MINYLIPFLIGFSLVVAGILLFIKNGRVRGLIVYPSIGIIVITVMILLGFYVNGTTFPTYENVEWVNYGMLGIELCLMLVIVHLSIKHNKFHLLFLCSVFNITKGYLFQCTNRNV